MNMNLWRLQYLATCTKGALYIGGDLFCFTLEPPLKFNGKQDVPDKTCINHGIYQVLSYASPHFGRVVPRLLTEPLREMIEMHPLNLPSQTEGCIGVGHQWINAPELGDSDRAFNALMGVLNPLWSDSTPVTIQIQSVFEVGNA